METTIHKSRLERYSDFVSRHSENGVYNPERGLGGLLSVLTPDTKGIVLSAMESGEVFFDRRQLYNSTLRLVERYGVDKDSFPLTVAPVWQYCRRVDKEGNIVEGSLVDLGAVVREVYYDTPAGMETGYHISTTGKELALPVVNGAVDFVDRTRRSDVPHTYDSMWRIFGAVNSSTEKRMPLATYKTVKFLIDNPSDCRAADAINALSSSLSKSTIEKIFRSLGNCGVIDYKSVGQETQGRSERGWSRYSFTGKPIDAQKVIQSGFYRKSKEAVPQVVQFIQANPDLIYEAEDVAGRLGISRDYVSGVFSALVELGQLNRESEFITHERRSVVGANDLTRMLYEIVLEPAWYSASTLQPAPTKGLEPEKLRLFLANYQEERTHLGSSVGESMRDKLMLILDSDEPLKVSHITEQANKDLGRGLKSKSITYHLDRLVEQGIVEKTATGFYRKRQ